MVERGYERHFRALRSGEMTFTEFALATATLWRRLAAQIHRRWKVPGWVTHEDTVQDMLMHASVFVRLYDPRRCGSVQRYVVWNSYDKAKKRVHAARQARRSSKDRADSSPSRIEKPFSSLSSAGAQERADESQFLEHVMFEGGAFVEADQEAALIRAEDRRDLDNRAWSHASSWEEVAAMEALATAGSFAEAAQALMRDERVRVELDLGDLAEAERVVARAAREVAKRLNAA